jgi:hypothetical protein
VSKLQPTVSNASRTLRTSGERFGVANRNSCWEATARRMAAIVAPRERNGRAMDTIPWDERAIVTA